MILEGISRSQKSVIFLDVTFTKAIAIVLTFTASACY